MVSSTSRLIRTSVSPISLASIDGLMFDNTRDYTWRSFMPRRIAGSIRTNLPGHVRLQRPPCGRPIRARRNSKRPCDSFFRSPRAGGAAGALSGDFLITVNALRPKPDRTTGVILMCIFQLLASFCQLYSGRRGRRAVCCAPVFATPSPGPAPPEQNWSLADNWITTPNPFRQHHRRPFAGSTHFAPVQDIANP